MDSKIQKFKYIPSFCLGILMIVGCSNKDNTQTVEVSKLAVYTTAKGTDLRISKTDGLKFTKAIQPLETEAFILVDPEHEFQNFVGIGGALTDAAAETFAKLPKVTQAELLDAYFDKDKGIAYNMGRTNINSCDFSSASYTYVTDLDTSLKSFDIKHDEVYKIPFIKKVLAATQNKLKLFVSPWSPPAWMKTNHDMLHGGKLLPEYRQTWANYYVKFINAYEDRGLPIWGLTVQNEPMAKQKWESCIYTANEEREFIKNFLGPTLKNNRLDDKKLIAWDHNRDLVYQRASAILNDNEAAKYVWGIGFHWYETWTGNEMQFDNVKKVKESFPDKHLIFTEGCQEKFNIDSVYNWSLGEKYAHSIINDFNDGTEAWTDWNILLDENGGPNHVGNFCFSPIHANTKTGKLIYTNAYYYIGHFSKFILPDAKRIMASSNKEDLEVTSFLNPDKGIVTVVLNKTNKPISFQMMIGIKSVKTDILAHSIVTYVAK
ncbi:MAG: glycoside hydrolase family 30 protein [Sphingobacteriales bacterium]|nr:glycoside hydrolase family 30 protein [Sphingobacteriales bacterium]